MAKSTFEKMGAIFRNRKIPLKTRFRILTSYVMSILTYCSETWTITVANEAMEAAEM